ncbi:MULTISPECIES: hypothetical protein [Acinetobacter]|uniref:hypothetical protein n=1 Tax=Acinetobacter TaxID=469 RepID=UPI000306BE51|nr:MULTISPECIES: hypothetical protein [Acinetobacter]
MSQNIDKEIRETEQELKHVGSCTTKGLTADQIAQLDERFFLAVEKLSWLKGRCDVKVKEWKSTSILNSPENVNRKPSLKADRCRKPKTNTWMRSMNWSEP